MLADQVSAGSLPPMAERMPSDPMVLEPFEQVGEYGGVMHFGNVETNLWNLTCLRTQGLVMYNQENTEVSVDIAESFAFSNELKTVTFQLRKGHRWSDGEPFTADDILFWWQDVQLNEDLSPAGPSSRFSPGGEPAVFTKLSDTEFEITFSRPWPVIMDLLGRSWFSADPNIMLPAHYMKQYHLAYNENANDLAAQEDQEDWTKAFSAHVRPGGDVDDPARPYNWAWIPGDRTSDRVVVDRNPYFHQADVSGNQLPYIDQIDTAVTGNKEVQILKATSGEFDFECWYLSLGEMPVLKENAQTGGYEVRTAKSLRASELALMPNRTVQDPLLEELFNTYDFRLALSLGIDRDAINDAIFFGLGTPYPALPLPSMSWIKPEWHTLHIEHDVDTANQLLDGLGLTEKDAEGFRLRTDNGQRLNVIVEIGSAEGPKLEMCELVADHWKSIGVEATVKNTEGTLFSQRNLANEMQIPTWHLDRSGLFGRGDPLWYGFDNPGQQRWCPMWATWIMSNGEEGIEPPQEIKDLYDLFNRWRETLPGTAEFDQLGSQYYEWFANEIPMIGTVGMGPVPQVVKNRLHNVPSEGIYWGSDTNFYAPYFPAQWYIKE